MNCDRGFGSFASDGACLCVEDPRGARHGRASSRDKLVYGRSVWILTMMQSCASAAKLRAAGPFFQSASVPCSNTVSRHLGSSIGTPPKNQRERRIVLSGIPAPVSPSGCWA
jgi:hypothetical protein